MSPARNAVVIVTLVLCLALGAGAYNITLADDGWMSYMNVTSQYFEIWYFNAFDANHVRFASLFGSQAFFLFFFFLLLIISS